MKKDFDIVERGYISICREFICSIYEELICCSFISPIVDARSVSVTHPSLCVVN